MRVLLAEDDMRLGKLIQYMLEQNDIDVEWVTDGNDIYSYATYAEYDILILDWMMPGETGVEACARLRRNGYDRAILVLTARDAVEDRVTILSNRLSFLNCWRVCVRLVAVRHSASSMRSMRLAGSS